VYVPHLQPQQLALRQLCATFSGLDLTFGMRLSHIQAFLCKLQLLLSQRQFGCGSIGGRGLS
jgi:hypothetical protein